MEFSEITKAEERIPFTEFALFIKGDSGRDQSVTPFNPDFMSNLNDNFKDIYASEFGDFMLRMVC